MPQTEPQPLFAPPERADTVHRRARPVDLVQLARQTGGDRQLEEEVLRLFLRQANSIGHLVRTEKDLETRRRNAHTLKGAALAIGAGGVAKRAGALQEAPGQSKCVRALVNEINTACDYINSLLR